MKRHRPRTHRASVLPILLLGCVASLAASTTQPAAGIAALDFAFRFASAIDPDPKDKAMAQESVVIEYGRLGAFDAAIRNAGKIDGWRRGTAYADLASMLAKQGRNDEARRLIEEARSIRATITDWHGSMIDARVAEVTARLGQTDTTQRIARDLMSDERQHAGRSLAVMAVLHASRGDFDKAMTGLDAAAGNADYVMVQGRVGAYLEIAGMKGLTDTQRRRALETARAAAATAPGWMSASLGDDVARAWIDIGDRETAKGILAEIEPVVRSVAATEPIKGALLSRLAVTYGRAGDAAKPKELLGLAEREMTRTQAIDQPAILAETAAAWHAIGDGKESRRVFDKAIATAEGLTNARPRALAVVAVCRAMGRENLPLDDAVKNRFDGLYAGLKDPW